MILVIDVGTTGLRAAAVGPDATIRHVEYRWFPPDTPFPGLVEFDAGRLAELVLSADKTELISVAAHLAFPIRDGVPMLSLEEARDVDPDEMRVQFPPTV